MIKVSERTVIVSDKTIQAEGLNKGCKTLGRCFAKECQLLATKVIENPRRASKAGANDGIAARSKTPLATLLTIPDVINFLSPWQNYMIRNNEIGQNIKTSHTDLSVSIIRI